MNLSSLRNDLYLNSYSMNDFYVSNMVGTSLKTRGTKVAHIKEVIKKYQNVNLKLDDIPLDESVELTMCYFALSLLKCKTSEEQFCFLNEKVEFAESWVITDFIDQYVFDIPYKRYKSILKSFVSSKKEYKIRFAYVYLMRYYKSLKFSSIQKYIINDERYYILMAQAWLIATYAVYSEDEVIQFLKSENISRKLRIKAISKIVDSFRISNDSKNRFIELRKL